MAISAYGRETCFEGAHASAYTAEALPELLHSTCTSSGAMMLCCIGKKAEGTKSHDSCISAFVSSLGSQDFTSAHTISTSGDDNDGLARTTTAKNTWTIPTQPCICTLGFSPPHAASRFISLSHAKANLVRASMTPLSAPPPSISLVW